MAEHYEQARRVLDANFEKLRQIPGFVTASVALKLREKQNKVEDYYCICIQVESKSDEAVARVPPDFEGVPTDVIQRDFRMAAQGGDALRAAVPGTLGLDVTGGPAGAATNFICFLTCVHVISATNNIQAPVPVFDGGINPLGTAGAGSKDWYYDAEVDCALVIPNFNPIFPRALKFGVPRPTQIRPPEPGDQLVHRTVWKVGQKTGHTTNGQIIDISYGTPTNPVPLDPPFTAVNQIRVASKGGTLFADKGDSGAILGVGKHAIGIIRAVHVVDKALGIGEVVACPLHVAASKLRFQV